MRPTRPTPDHLRRLAADLLTVVRIAERLGVSPATASAWLRDAGIVVNPARHRSPIVGWGSGAGAGIRGGTRRR